MKISAVGFPSIEESEIQGRTGVHLVGLKINQELKWVFREKPTTDIGIDGEIELRDMSKESHGRLVAAQIKCGPSYLREQTDNSIIFRGDYIHLRYWANYSIPVIVIICDPITNTCWWQSVDMQRVNFHKEGWSMEVDKCNILDSSSIEKLTKVASRLQKKDIIELALRDWVGWRFNHRMRIASLFESPRDYHWFSHLGAIDQEYYMIDFVLADVKGFDQEEVESYFEAAKLNHKAFGYEHLLLAFVSESPKHLHQMPHPPTIPGIRIEFVYLLLEINGEPQLAELCNDMDVVAFYPGGDPINAHAADVSPIRRVTDGRGLSTQGI